MDPAILTEAEWTLRIDRHVSRFSKNCFGRHNPLEVRFWRWPSRRGPKRRSNQYHLNVYGETGVAKIEGKVDD
jgi:hypothetical protein